MAKIKFNDSWYVRKDRINLFIPFEKDYSIEINKIGGGSVKGTTTNRFSNTNDKYYGLNFSEASADVVALDASLTRMLNQAFYGRKQVTTLAFWAKNTDANAYGDTTYGMINNAVLADSWTEGYVFYPAGYTVTVPTTNEVGHKLNLNGMKKRENSLVTELITTTGNTYTQSTGLWALNVYIIEHSEAVNGPTTKCTIHVLYNDTDNNFNHYWAIAENMNSSVVGTRTNNVSNIWSIGGCQNGHDENNVITYGYLYEGKLRNLMLYNIALSFDEIVSLFEHGIDPFEASGIANTDVDSFDSNFWGKYGVIAENSNVKFEKCLIGDVDDEFSNMTIKSQFSTAVDISQNKGRFDVAGRDASHLEVINRNNSKLTDGEVTGYSDYTVDNPTTDEQTYKYGYGSTNTSLLSVGVWRNSFATGNGKIRFTRQVNSKHEIVSKAIGGSFIEGGTDLIKIDPEINPETLPSGRYTAEWVVNKPNNTNYPTFLPADYLRDRLGRSYKGYDFKTSIPTTVASGSAASTTAPTDAKYVNGAFWGNTARYEKVSWTKARDFTNSSIADDYFLSIEESKRIDLCSAWNPVFWMKAIYEVNNEPTISSRGYFSTIRLVLVDETMTKSAVYYKLGKPLSKSTNTNIRIEYGDWQFDSFNSINNIRDKERLARIFLPHAYVPKIQIPATRINITKAEDGNSNTIGAIANGDIGVATTNGGSLRTFRNSKVTIGDNPLSENYASTDTWSWPAYFMPVISGIYEITWHWSWKVNDNNYTVTGSVEIGSESPLSVSGGMGDYVNHGSKGGGYGVLTLKMFVYINSNQKAKITATYKDWVTWVTVRRVSVGGVVTNVNSIIVENTSTGKINGVPAKLLGNDIDGYYYEVENVPVKYTKSITSITNDNPYA